MSLIQGAHECLSANNSIWRISPRKSSLSSKLLLFLNLMLSSSILKPAWTSPLPWPILRAPLHMSHPLMTFWSWPKIPTLICAKTANGQVCPISFLGDDYSKLTCWNCSRNHHIKDWPEPHNQDLIKAWQEILI